MSSKCAVWRHRLRACDDLTLRLSHRNMRKLLNVGYFVGWSVSACRDGDEEIKAMWYNGLAKWRILSARFVSSVPWVVSIRLSPLVNRRRPVLGRPNEVSHNRRFAFVERSTNLHCDYIPKVGSVILADSPPVGRFRRYIIIFKDHRSLICKKWRSLTHWDLK